MSMMATVKRSGLWQGYRCYWWSVSVPNTSVYMLPSLPPSHLPLGVGNKPFSISYSDLHSRTHSFHADDRQWRWDIGKRATADSQMSS